MSAATLHKRARRLAALAGEMVLLTVAAQITTLPLLMAYQRSLSPVNLAANLLILPAQPAHAGDGARPG